METAKKVDKAILLPIHKKGKETKAESHRSISLESCMFKLMERIINHGLMWFLEKSSSLMDEQAGLRQNRSAEDQVTYIVQKIKYGFHNKKHTIAVWIDMEKAYDKRKTAEIKTTVDGIETNSDINKQYPQNQWVRIDTDGSAINAIENGETDVHTERPNGTSEAHSFPTGIHCSNYKPEATVIEHASEKTHLTLQQAK
ncbi:RNA-directed DNA polymerase from mobile element jockey-like protein [Plakobranchus ocellatus]|uniref:RNA-directed DNA polymerase from mobile element jockey-like protein n=1 Tax=Plakobranchus ocellatus TaxID=259542 RepID=A0AAV4DL96_9GAST|nr:RNA-directed DNA polymerase from mobile element jockey-like protein [Plakobranchus ocellatus]